MRENISLDDLLLIRARGKALEAEHRGCLALIDSTGKVIYSYGYLNRTFFPRSSIKLIQALPFFITGAAKSLNCSTIEKVLSTSSHSGEANQIEALENWCQRLGLNSSDLSSGVDLPLNPIIARLMSAKNTEISPFMNNNVGKHLAILSTCLFLNENIQDYCQISHPAQIRITKIIEEICETKLDKDDCQIDNCGMLTLPISAYHLALGMAKIGMSSDENIIDMLTSIKKEPNFIAGENRLISKIIKMTKGGIILKGGSEGVFSGYLEDLKLGFTLKVNDGSGEAASLILIQLLLSLGILKLEQKEELQSKIKLGINNFYPERSQSYIFPFLDSLKSYNF